MKELFILRIFGVDIIAKESVDWPLGAEKYLNKRLNLAKELIEKLVKKEYTMPTDEEIMKELYEKQI